MKPPNWEKINPNPCKGCPDKLIDDYGYVCDVACGRHSAHVNRERGTGLMLDALKADGYYITPTTYIDYVPLIAHLKCQDKKGWIVFIEEL